MSWTRPTSTLIGISCTFERVQVQDCSYGDMWLCGKTPHWGKVLLDDAIRSSTATTWGSYRLTSTSTTSSWK